MTKKGSDLADSFLFEVSWEVCNKVGGIYTVLQSKAKYFTHKFKDYYLIGPYFEDSAYYDFIEEDMPEDIQEVNKKLKPEGIKIHYGRWLVEGTPKVLLVDFMEHSPYTNTIKGKLWELHGIDSLNTMWFDFDKPILWAWCVGKVVEEIMKNKKENAILHTHEWMSGAAQFYIKSLNDKKFSTVFTTHATSLGRTMAGKGGDPHHIPDDFDPSKTAYQLGVAPKHFTEKKIACQADVFTTVSELTNKECEKFLGRKADVVRGGFDSHKYYEKDFETEYVSSREKTNNFLKAFFNPYYSFNPDNSYLMYTSGRYEINSKGTNLVIDSLKYLNEELKEQKSKKSLVFFFLIPIDEFDPEPQLKKDLSSVYAGEKFSRRNGNPLISTHHIDKNIELLTLLNEKGLTNKKEDNVKVVVVPRYLNGFDGILNRTYYQIIKGFDMGLFPSFYEPWGYTPIESIANAVPSVSSDLSGFGRYLKENYKDQTSVNIIRRENISYESSTKQLYNILNDFLNLTQKRQLAKKSEAKKFSENFSWEYLSEDYTHAYIKSKN